MPRKNINARLPDPIPEITEELKKAVIGVEPRRRRRPPKPKPRPRL